MNPASERMLTQTEIKDRGWNATMIRQFLGEPDEERRNPFYRSMPPMKLFKVKRVEQAEALPAFQAMQALRQKRQEAAQKGAMTKLQKTDAYVNSIKIEVPEMTKEELIQRALANYYAHRDGSQTQADSGIAVNFTERICVNYLRHRLTSYEENLRRIKGRVGSSTAYLQIKSQVLDAIGCVYPWLFEECLRQDLRTLNRERLRL